MAEGAGEAEIGDPNGTHHSSCNVTAARRTKWGETLQLAKGGCVQYAGTAAKPLQCGCRSAGLSPLSYLIKLTPVHQSLTSNRISLGVYQPPVGVLGGKRPLWSCLVGV